MYMSCHWLALNSSSKTMIVRFRFFGYNMDEFKVSQFPTPPGLPIVCSTPSPNSYQSSSSSHIGYYSRFNHTRHTPKLTQVWVVVASVEFPGSDVSNTPYTISPQHSPHFPQSIRLLRYSMECYSLCCLFLLIILWSECQ